MKMALVRIINNHNHFHEELANAGSKLVIVDFTATWCGPCQRISPVFERLSEKYLYAVFLKVDVDKCAETATAEGINAMPTFIFYRNRVKIDSIQGADSERLESKIQHFYNLAEVNEFDGLLQGHIDLNSLILKAECECLNESDNHCFIDCLTADDGYLESDCDEQLIISITFAQAVKVHSLKIKAPESNGPKTIKLFINQPRTIDFDMANTNTSIQDIELSMQDITEGNPIPLRYVKFQNVQNLQIFVKDNQNQSDKTQINYLSIIGSPITTTNMSDFKRVAGKKGESH